MKEEKRKNRRNWYADMKPSSDDIPCREDWMWSLLFILSEPYMVKTVNMRKRREWRNTERRDVCLFRSGFRGCAPGEKKAAGLYTSVSFLCACG